MVRAVFFNLKNWGIHQYWEKTIAKHMELNGDDVYTISASKLFGGDDLKSNRRYEHIHAHIASKTGEQTSQMFQIKKQLALEDFFTQQDLNKAEYVLGPCNIEELETLIYKGLNLGKIVRNSVVRQSHTLDKNDPEYQHFFYENISTLIYEIDAFERILTQIKPDVVFCMNGIFFAERALVEMCKLRGIRIVTYERAARPDYLYITANEPINLFNYDNRYDKIKDVELTPKEKQEIIDYLEDRKTSKNTTQKFQNSKPTEIKEVKERINYDKIKKQKKEIITLYTNVMWDTAAIDRDTIFDNVLDWCIKTVEFAKNNKNKHFVIRIHPADSRYWNFAGAKQLQDEILKAIELPENVTLIKSNEKINSYALAELSDKVVTYTSQIGPELAAMGKSLIIAGEAFYRNKGFGYTPKTQKDYFDALKEIIQTQDFEKENALKFEHFLYFKMHYPLHLIVEDASKGMGVVTNLKFIQDNTIDFNMIKNDEELKYIADYIREGIEDEYNCPVYRVTPTKKESDKQ